MQGKTTLKTLAEILEISPSTVSKALHDSPEISEKLKVKIRELAKKEHYIPNAMGRNLKSRETKTIGVIIPDILPHFFAKALYGMEAMAGEMGYQIVICISNESLKKEIKSIHTMISSGVDGVVMSLSQETQAKMQIEHLLQLKKYGIELVLFDRVLSIINCDKVSINDALQAEQATVELIKSGCKKVGYLTNILNTSVDDQRKQGYQDAMKRYKLRNRVIGFNPKDEFPAKQINTLIAEGKLDAILAANELSAIMTIKSVLDSGYEIPKDVSVIGFTNGVISANFRPSLSSIDQHEEEQGRLAMETIIERLQGKLPKEPLDYKLRTSIIHRETTRHE
ncbi:LacI family DNA-binding transcriptional regulator [Gramella sp. AN32]|uniref:LacI family DNA-binding transcriptional regulator n=1 Tax=Christiangramia antarctica TaxID=2058158 RepID=A0ABW5WZK3_9FLAO|nr:LacI family DNA-binding transcriptional regulator [Gramella sp. AN32]MCM4155632.1 LacI family transcriptional regulator [Gramella sp. AN32]